MPLFPLYAAYESVMAASVVECSKHKIVKNFKIMSVQQAYHTQIRSSSLIVSKIPKFLKFSHVILTLLIFYYFFKRSALKNNHDVTAPKRISIIIVGLHSKKYRPAHLGH